MRTTRDTSLETLSTTARQLAGDLFSAEQVQCCRPEGKPSCLQAEEDRPLTKEEKQAGWVCRPFFAYDPLRMCSGCQAYFYAERAAQVLHEMYCWQRKAEANKK